MMKRSLLLCAVFLGIAAAPACAGLGIEFNGGDSTYVPGAPLTFQVIIDSVMNLNTFDITLEVESDLGPLSDGQIQLLSAVVGDNYIFGPDLDDSFISTSYTTGGPSSVFAIQFGDSNGDTGVTVDGSSLNRVMGVFSILASSGLGNLSFRFNTDFLVLLQPSDNPLDPIGPDVEDFPTIVEGTDVGNSDRGPLAPQSAVVPEPSSALLCVSFLGCLALRHLSRRRRPAAA